MSIDKVVPTMQTISVVNPPFFIDPLGDVETANKIANILREEDSKQTPRLKIPPNPTVDRNPLR